MNQKLIDDLIKIAGENIDDYPEAARWITEQAAKGMAPTCGKKLPKFYSVTVNSDDELLAVCPGGVAGMYVYPSDIRNDGYLGIVEYAHYTFAEWEELTK